MSPCFRNLSRLFPALMIAVLSMAVAPGDPAPDFTAKDQDGREVRLSALKGRAVLLYFYPKDDTPGCTKEACSIRDGWDKFKKLGVAVYGVSSQGAESHRRFKDKHRLPFDLICDEDGKVAEAFGVGKMPVIGLFKRQSVLIGRDGKVIRFYNDVDPGTHSAGVLHDVEEYLKSSR